MNFKTHYLSHCRVIPLQSFGSNIFPQQHGLGLTLSPMDYVYMKIGEHLDKVAITLFPTALTIHGSRFFKAKFLKKSFNNINLKKTAHP